MELMNYRNLQPFLQGKVYLLNQIILANARSDTSSEKLNMFIFDHS